MRGSIFHPMSCWWFDMAKPPFVPIYLSFEIPLRGVLKNNSTKEKERVARSFEDIN